jgi:hypothetical protein
MYKFDNDFGIALLRVNYYNLKYYFEFMDTDGKWNFFCLSKEEINKKKFKFFVYSDKQIFLSFFYNRKIYNFRILKLNKWIKNYLIKKIEYSK